MSASWAATIAARPTSSARVARLGVDRRAPDRARRRRSRGRRRPGRGPGPWPSTARRRRRGPARRGGAGRPGRRRRRRDSVTRHDLAVWRAGPRSRRPIRRSFSASDAAASRSGLGQDDQELLAAVAAGDVDGADAGGEQLADVAQDRVARGVAVGVVEALEVVEVDDDRPRAGGGTGSPGRAPRSSRASTAWRLAMPVSGSTVARRQVSATRSARSRKASRSLGSAMRSASRATSALSSAAVARRSASRATPRTWRRSMNSEYPADPARAPMSAATSSTAAAAIWTSKGPLPNTPRRAAPVIGRPVPRGYGRAPRRPMTRWSQRAPAPHGRFPGAPPAPGRVMARKY